MDCVLILKLSCAVLFITILALLALIVVDDGKVCFDYGALKDRAVGMVVGSESVPVE
jgi:hypothetical protein